MPVLPGMIGLHLENCVVTEPRITIAAAGAATEGGCPECGPSAARVHSRDPQRLLDVPWDGIPVQFNLPVRHFCCDAEPCGRTTFAEPVAGSTRPHAHRPEA